MHGLVSPMGLGCFLTLTKMYYSTVCLLMILMKWGYQCDRMKVEYCFHGFCCQCFHSCSVGCYCYTVYDWILNVECVWNETSASDFRKISLFWVNLKKKYTVSNENQMKSFF